MTRALAKPKRKSRAVPGAKEGAPRKYDRAALEQKFLAYIDETDIPIVSEFAILNGMHREQVYEMPELSYALKRCISKKEMALEQKALSGDVNCSMAIFSLKQIGWSDKQETTHKGSAANPVYISNVDAKL